MTIHMQSWQLNNQIRKGPNPTASSEAPGTKARYCEWSLHRAPQNGARRPPRPWLSFTSPPPGSGREQGNMFLVFLHWCCSTSTGKALPEFLIWPLVNFYWLKGQKKKKSNTQKYEMTGTLINLKGKILLQYIHVSNYHIVHFKYLTTLFVKCTSIKLKRWL